MFPVFLLFSQFLTACTTTLSIPEYDDLIEKIHSRNIEAICNQYDLRIAATGVTWVDTLNGLTYHFQSEDVFSLEEARKIILRVLNTLKNATSSNSATSSIPGFKMLDMEHFHVIISSHSRTTSDEFDERISMISAAGGVIHYGRQHHGHERDSCRLLKIHEETIGEAIAMVNSSSASSDRLAEGNPRHADW